MAEERSLLDRALPADARAAFAKRLVAWHLEELNGLQGQLRHLRDGVARATTEEALEGHRVQQHRLKLRQNLSLEALRWNGPETLPLLWALVDEGQLQVPEDLFGAAAALLELDADPERLAEWLRTVGPEARELLAADGLSFS